MSNIKIGGENSITSIDIDERPEFWNNGFVTVKWVINGENNGICIHRDRLLEIILDYYEKNVSN